MILLAACPINTMNIYDWVSLNGWTNKWPIIHTIRVDNASDMHLQLFNKNLENQVLPLKPDSFAGGLPNSTGLLAIMPTPYKVTTEFCHNNPSLRRILKSRPLSALLYHPSPTIMMNHTKEQMLLYSPLQISKPKLRQTSRGFRSSPRWKNLIF